MTDDRHRCLAGPACRHADIIEDGGGRTRMGAQTVEPDTLCDACLDHVEDCCRQLPADWAQLEAALGDQQGSGTEFVSSTPTPAVPINTTADAIMAQIVEVADRAAAVISDRLNCGHPGDRRRALPKARVEGKLIDPAPGSLACCIITKPDDRQQLDANIRLILPNIDVLCRAPKQPAMVWDKDSPADVVSTEWFKAAAGRYYPISFNGHRITEQSGIDLALQIADMHRLTRAHLGYTLLRHRYPMPCPHVDKHGTYCGATTVGRNDGTDVVDCLTCGTCWTQREYDFLAGLTGEEIIGQHFADPNQRLEAYRMLQWLLAEAYWRLDQTRHTLDIMQGDESIDLPGAGTIILQALAVPLDGHQPPENRKTSA